MSAITIVIFRTINTFRTNDTLFNLFISLDSLAKQKLSTLMLDTDFPSSMQLLSETLFHNTII